MKTTVKVKFRPSTVQDCPGHLVYFITHRRIVRQITTEYKIFPEEWDGSHSKVVVFYCSRADLIRQIEQRLLQDMNRIDMIINELKNNGKDFTADNVVSRFRNMAVKHTFSGFMSETISRLKQLGKVRTAEAYASTLRSFIRFRNNEEVLFEEVGPDLMWEYEAFLKSNGVTKNTSSFYMRILRAVYNRAAEKGLAEQSNPFKYVYTGIDKTVRRAIPIEAVKRIKALDLPHEPLLDFARDMFLFSFYTRGMSFVDMAFLRMTDLQYGILSYRRRKTGQQLFIRWEKCMQAILEKYPANEAGYLLPIIRMPGNERRQYRNMQRLVNNKLKMIQHMIGLRMNLTMYVSRHSWASIARSRNIPLSVISEGMGHDSETTTQIYLASLDNSVVDNANETILKML